MKAYRAGLVFSALAALAPEASALQAKKGKAQKTREGVEWRPGNLDGALKEAAERNLPLLVSILPQRESSNVRVRAGLFLDERFLAAAARCVCVVGLDAEHAVAARGEDPSRCAYFPTLACADHVQMARELLKRFGKDGAIAAPLHIVLTPEGKVHERIENSPTHEGEGERDRKIVAAAESASRAAGRGLERPRYLRFVEELPKADRALEREEFGAAAAVYREVLGAIPTGPLAARARAGSEEGARRAEEALKEAADRQAAGEATAAYDLYVRLERALQGTNLVKKAKDGREGLEKNPKTRGAIEAHRRFLEAAELLKEAKRLEEGGEKAKAVSLYERIVRNFHETESAEISKQRLRVLSGGDSSR